MKKRNKKIGRKIESIVLLIAVGVFIYAALNIFGILKLNKEEKDEISEIREIVKVPDDELDEFSIDFNELLSINEDVVGWIVVEDTAISYPIVQGKDNEYYLNHTFKKYENYAGSIFMDYRANRNFEDHNTFIYGHNVFHGTMFAELSNYMDKAFLEAHPYIYLYTPTQNYKLQVASAYVDKEDSDSYKNQQYYTIEQYQEYINMIMKKSRHNTNVSLTTDDKIVTLYTCSYESGNNPSNTEAEDINDRYYIHAKIIKVLDEKK